jgi:hypothetical protein
MYTYLKHRYVTIRFHKDWLFTFAISTNIIVINSFINCFMLLMEVYHISDQHSSQAYASSYLKWANTLNF